MALDLSTLQQPGASASGPMPAPNQPALPPEVMTPAVAPPSMDQPAEPGINPQVPPAPPAGGTSVGTPNPPKHAALLAMVTGLADGLAGFSKSIATHGQVSGAEVVQELQGQRQAQQQAQQAAAEARKNAELQQKLMVAQTAEIVANTSHNLATLPDEITKSHLSAEQAKVGVAEQKFNLFAGTGLTPDQIDKITTGGSTDAATSDRLQTNLRQQSRLASQLLPADNPALSGLKQALDNPKTPLPELVVAGQQLQKELNGQEKITDAQIKKAAADAAAPFGDKAKDLNAAMLERYQVLHPGAAALPSALTLDSKSTPKDFDRVDKILQQTENAEGTEANRQIVNAMREQTLGLAEGKNIPGDATKQGSEYLSSLPPGIQGTVKAIGEGRAAPPPAGSRSPAAQAVLGALNRAYPNYDSTLYPTYKALREKFTSGKEAAGINSFNTVAAHLQRMYDNTSAEGTLPGVSGAARFFGNKQAAALNTDRQAVATELSKAYANGQISEGEVNEWSKKLSVWSPLEMRNNIKEVASLLQGKLDAYKNQWDTGMPSGVPAPLAIISPTAQSAFARIEGGSASSPSGTINVTDPNGGVHTFADQAAADNFKKLAGIK